MKAMRDQIGGLADDFPRNAKIVSVERSPEPESAGPAEWIVKLEIDGAEVLAAVLTAEIAGRHYAMSPAKR